MPLSYTHRPPSPSLFEPHFSDDDPRCNPLLSISPERSGGGVCHRLQKGSSCQPSHHSQHPFRFLASPDVPASVVLQAMGSDWSKLCKVGQPAPAAARALARTNVSPSSARLNARCMKGWAGRGDPHAAAALLTFIQDSLANAGATRPLAIGCVCAAR